jgi:regulator of replication initiation timing
MEQHREINRLKMEVERLTEENRKLEIIASAFMSRIPKAQIDKLINTRGGNK